MSTTIPSPYRIVFTTIDPLIAASGLIFHQLPALALSSYATHPVLPPSTETRLLMDAMSACFACFVWMEIFVLQAAPNNVAVWKAFQAGILLSDIGMVGAFCRALSSAGRLPLTLWRAGEWTNIGVTVAVGIIRMIYPGCGSAKRCEEEAVE